MTDLNSLSNCTLCADRFSNTATSHSPRPIVWFRDTARVLIAGQAPGARVHKSGTPFDDPSGDRLREWMGVGSDVFYDKTKLAIVPMGFCFPGYDDKGSDLPPPKLCRDTWHDVVMASLSNVRLKLIVGGYAHKYHLGVKTGVTETVQNWRDFGPDIFPLPHPSWRNTGWLKRNPWFEAELLPVLRARLKTELK